MNYEFNTGEIVFITGGNGSGKSTLAKLITGLYAPNKGYITLNNNKVSEKVLNEIYSTVFGDFYLFDEWAADQDPEFRLFFYNTLLPELKGRGKCVIAITHDDHYFNMADKIIRMEMGKIN